MMPNRKRAIAATKRHLEDYHARVELNRLVDQVLASRSLSDDEAFVDVYNALKSAGHQLHEDDHARYRTIMLEKVRKSPLSA